MELTIVQADDRLLRVKLMGRLDVAGVNRISLEFARQVATRRKPTIVDLSDVEFIASLGMGMLVENAKALKRNNVRMVVADPQQLVEEALRSAGLDAVFGIGHGPAEIEALLTA